MAEATLAAVAAPAAAPATQSAVVIDGAPATPVTPPALPADASITIPDSTAAPQAPQADATIVYEPTGDAGLDMALEYVGERGFGPDHPAMKAAMKGDFKALETALGGLGDKAKDSAKFLKLAQEAYGRQSAAATNKAKAAEKLVHDTVGGAENWTAIKGWITAEADPTEKAEINAAFAIGGAAAAAMARSLAEGYAKVKPATTKSVLKPDAAGAPSTGNALTPRDFSTEVAKLHAKIGNRMESSPEYAELVARRRSYRPA